MPAIANSSTIKPKTKSTQKPAFKAQAFLDSAGIARKIVEYRKSQKIYSQGDAAKNIFYIQNGGIKLSVVNEVGKEAVVAILAPGDFFGGRVSGSTECSHGNSDRDRTHDLTRDREKRDDSRAPR